MDTSNGKKASQNPATEAQRVKIPPRNKEQKSSLRGSPSLIGSCSWAQVAGGLDNGATCKVHRASLCSYLLIVPFFCMGLCCGGPQKGSVLSRSRLEPLKEVFRFFFASLLWGFLYEVGFGAVCLSACLCVDRVYVSVQYSILHWDLVAYFLTITYTRIEEAMEMNIGDNTPDHRQAARLRHFGFCRVSARRGTRPRLTAGVETCFV